MYRVVVTARRLPKSGSPLSECEDATCPSPAESGEGILPGEGISVAVADGATTYSYSKEWAEIICREQAALPMADATDLLARLPGWQSTWAESIEERVANLSWFAAAKVDQGAFSTFLQLSLRPEGMQGGSWTALAVGDSCLVQCRNGKLVKRGDGSFVCFPLNSPEAFAARPFLLPTRRELIPRIAEHVCQTDGTWRPGDEFLLMTDALAAWFYSEVENGRNPMNILRIFLGRADSVTSEAIIVDDKEMMDSPVEPPTSGFLQNLLREKGYRRAHGAVRSAAAVLSTTTSSTADCPKHDVQLSEHEILDGVFQTWAENMKAAGALKDDDVSFVHVLVVTAEGIHA
ncbi:hypothetical protein CTI14_02750 [Methylobacterium radiotolerans]|nr:hypothetical protein CTI14_02750 [Methylobacterium radiotolerans]